MNAPTPDGPVGGSRELPPLQGDGLPTLPTGEPVLARWFVLTMLLLAPIAIAVTVWAFLSIPRARRCRLRSAARRVMRR
jgi:hypothetical protein